MEGSSGGTRRVTAREAATLLGVHYNTVRNRIKDGTIQAEKVVTEHGPTWLIDRDTLTHNTHTSADQQLVGRVSEEALTFLAREIVREAGIAGDPEREARLEGKKLEAEAAKTQVLISSGLLVGMAAVAGVLPTRDGLVWLVAAFFLVVMSLIASLGEMHQVAYDTADQIHRRRASAWTPLFNLSVGLFAFTWFLLDNVPPGPPDRGFTWQDLVAGVLAALLAVLIGYVAARLLRLRWRRWRRGTSDAP